MVSSIDPTWDSINALLRWKPEDEFLEVKEGKTSAGAKVKYIGVRDRPGFWGWLAEKFFNLFGGGTWSSDRVVETLDVVIGDATKLSPEQTEAVKRLFPKIKEFDSKHKGKISATLISRFEKLAPEEVAKHQASASKPAAQVLTDIRKGRAHPPHRPPTKGKMPPVPETPPSAVPPPEPSSKKPVGAAGLGLPLGLEEKIRRRQAKLDKPSEQKS